MAELHTATALSSGELADDLEIPARKAAATGLKKLTLGQIKEACKATGLLTLKGTTDCSTNPNYPTSSLKGDTYYVTVAGKIGGASGKSVDVGDAYVCLTDNAGGTEASVGTSWFVLEHNLVSAITGALATTTEQLTGTDATKIATPDSVAALWEKGADVASAATTTLGEGGFFHVTGTTTVTALAFSTDKAGRRAHIEFTGALTLTHNATSLILPGAANITTAAGDTALFVSEGSGNFRCLFYQKASGKAVAPIRRNFVMMLSGTALASAETLLAITPVGDETLTFAGNLANSTGQKMTGGTNPASTFTGDIKKNNSAVGTWVISTSGVVSFTTTSGAAITIAPGDILEFVGPGTASTAVGFMFSIAATATY